MVAAASPRGLALLEFTDRRGLERQVAILRKRHGAAVLPGNNDHLVHIEGELESYFAGDLRQFEVPLDAPGTPFQRSVSGTHSPDPKKT